MPANSETLEDVFNEKELEQLFGAGQTIPQWIGPHRVVMSLEEAEQVEGEIFPAIIIGFIVGGTTGSIVDLMTNPDSTIESRTKSALIWGTAGAASAIPGWGIVAGSITAGIGEISCYTCHQAK